jgi:hypothetical protein
MLPKHAGDARTSPRSLAVPLHRLTRRRSTPTNDGASCGMGALCLPKTSSTLRGSKTPSPWLTWTDAALGHAIGHYHYVCCYA